MGATRLASGSRKGRKIRTLLNNTGFYITKFKYHLCYYLNLFAILAKGTVR